MSKLVTRDQFEVTGDGAVTHLPSRTRLTKIPSEKLDRLHVEYFDGAGDQLASNGDEYDSDQVMALAIEILRDTRARDH